MANPPTTYPPTALRSSSAAPAPSLADRWTQICGWLLLVAAMYCFHAARPEQHKLDAWFGATRSLRWHEGLATAAVTIASTSFVLAIAALSLRLLRPRTKHWTPPVGAGVLGLLSLACLLLALLRV